MKGLFEVEDNASILLETGYHKPLSTLTVTDVPMLCNALRSHHGIIKVKAELDQFCEGLETLGVLQSVKKHPNLMRPLFVASSYVQLTRGRYLCGY